MQDLKEYYKLTDSLRDGFNFEDITRWERDNKDNPTFER